MKISLAWIFDHINADYQSIDINTLVERFNASTAEIEGVEKINLDKKLFTIVTCKEVSDAHVTAQSSEWEKELKLPGRADAKVGDLFMVYQDGAELKWARSSHFGGSKNDLLPALFCKEEELSGAWKETIEWEDYILEMDNKTITNRPDMWGHRGFAREIAALMKLPFNDIDTHVAELNIEQASTTIKTSDKTPVAIDNKAPNVCRRFAGLHISSINHTPSVPWIAVRLARAEARAIDLLVDLTNYVMLDLSQPMHVFDVEKLQDKRIVPRMAQDGEKLTLLDGQTITLTKDDLVITDGVSPVALAGVMGGTHSAEGSTTKELFIESANFDGSAIRLSAARHKIRTESSARFEKELDKQQNTTSLKRFLYLLQKTGLPFSHVSHIASVGIEPKPHAIDLTHTFLESRIGATITSDFVVQTLNAIGFAVTVSGDKENTIYQVTVPSYRADHITIAEDIVEEVARFFGYSNIPLALPKQSTHLTDIYHLMQARKIKQHMAHAVNMMEIQHYSLFDESYSQKIQWTDEDAITMKNPVSQTWQSLLTSLVPHLCKAVTENSAENHKLNFFVLGRTWHEHDIRPQDSSGYVVGSGPYVIERKKLAGIFFDAKQEIDFYSAKAKLNSLFELLKLPITWIKAEQKISSPWYDVHQTANLVHNDTHIGTAGMADPTFFGNVADGNAWIFELDGDFLQTYKAPKEKFSVPSKYPHVWLDISLLVPLTCTVAQLSTAIEQADDRIISTELIDFFTKEEWGDKKSITFRFVVQDNTKTLTKDDVDGVWNGVVKNVTAQHAQVR